MRNPLFLPACLLAVSCFNLGGAALAQAEHHPPGLRALADRRGLRLGTAVRIGLLQPQTDGVFALVKSLKAQGVPITEVGMQWHVDVNTSVAPGDGHYRVAQRLKDNGMDFRVTELDAAVPIVVYPKGDPRYGLVPARSADLNEQGRVYGEVLRYALHFPNCRGVNVWEFTDRYRWIPDFTTGRLKQVPPGVPQGAATLLDLNYQPKPAYLAVRRVLALPE